MTSIVTDEAKYIQRGIPVSNGKLAMWLFLVTEIMFFTGLIGTYIVLRLGTPEGGWPRPVDVHLSEALGAINTFVLIFSSFTVVMAHSAIVRATEIGDGRRFAPAGQLMAYAGLVPRKHSSGPRQRIGANTKVGNSHCRHALVQAAWSYRHVPNIAAALRARQRTQPASVIAHAWKAQHWLHRLFQPLEPLSGPSAARRNPSA
ncbi:MAG: transposase [Bryobacteraceae bacterium]|nr:transposase [Bryobacteraceae bacterium]